MLCSEDPSPTNNCSGFSRGFVLYPPSCDGKRVACYRGAGARQDGGLLPTRMERPMEPGKEELDQGAPALLRGALDMQKRAEHGAEKLCWYLDSRVSLWPD